jgi:uncharacterized protein YnzC (UPF0291/DUF896 family)
MLSEKIDRINELSQLARTRELTEEEKNEREILRNEYRQAMKNSLFGQMSAAGILEEVDGDSK